MSVKFWNDDEIALLEALRPVCNTREIQRVLKSLEFDRTMEAISKKARTLGVSFKDFGLPSTAGLSEEAIDMINVMLQDREEQLSAVNPPIAVSSAQKAQNTMKSRNIAADLLNDLQEIRAQVPRTSSVSTRRASGDKESLVVVMSDNHFGRTFEDEDGTVLYNMQIARERVISTPEKIADALSREKRKQIDEVVLCLIGDHIDGEGVFPAQEMSLETHIVEQVKQCVRAFWECIQKLRSMFPMVRVITTRGNHGRGGISPESNWDNIVYQELELLIDITADPNLTIKNKYGAYNTLDVKGWRGMLRHKAPVQADTASALAKYAGWHGIHEWDFFCYGHWHHWGIMTWNSKPIFRNGTIMGADDYAESLAVKDEPVQLCFCVSEKQIPTNIMPIRYQE